MDWLEEYLSRIALAGQGTQLVEAIYQPPAERNLAEIAQRAEGWFEQALRIEWGFDGFKESVVQCAGYFRDQIQGQTHLAPTHLDCASNAIVNDANRFLRGTGERERRYAFIEFIRRVPPAYVTSEAEAAQAFRVDRGYIEQWVDWGIDQGFLSEYNAMVTDGRNVLITSEGREWLDDERATIVSGAKVRKAQSGTSFDVDLSFLHDRDQRAILDAMLVEMSAAVAAGLPMASIVLAGAMSEGILYDALVARKAAAMASPKAPKVKGAAKLVKDIDSDAYEHEWTLRDLIDVARDIGVLGENAGRMANDVLRDFRNMIHPKKQAKSGRRPGAPEMKGCVAWLEALARDVAEAPP